jgi:hypothetical protein
MTEAGKAFVERMLVVNRMINGGAAVFPALAAGLEDDDWLLVYAAIGRLVHDLEHPVYDGPTVTAVDHPKERWFRPAESK